MLELLQITNDPAFAARCDAIEGVRIFVDLERNGKAERQAGRNSFISTHELDDVARVRAVLRRARLMVRVNPLHADSAAEIDSVLAAGADLLMLPMFTQPAELAAFCSMVSARVPVVALLETAQALRSVEQWIGTPGLWEVFVGLNDLHLSLGCRFMFEPLAEGHIERVARLARGCGLRWGFGGIARLDEGLLPGASVLAEHERLGSGAVILSRTFHRPGHGASFEDEVAALRRHEAVLASRSDAARERDAECVRTAIRQIAARMGASTP